MKRVGIWVLVLMVLLSGCGKPEESKKSEYSGNNYAIGEKIVEIADQYLDFEISAEEASETIKELYGRLSETTAEDSMGRINDMLVVSYSNALDFWFGQMRYGGKGGDQEILEARNSLARALYIEER